VSKAVGYFLESLTQRLHQQLVLACEMLVKTTVGQARVPHNGRNSSAGYPFVANAPRGVFHDLLMDFGFVFGPVTHGSL